MTTREQRSCAKIDDLLTPAGWAAQSRDQMNLGIARGLFCSGSIK